MYYLLTMQISFQSYVSGLILVYKTTQSRFSGCFEEEYAANIDLIDKLIEVLDFYGKLDPVARQLSRTLSQHSDFLKGGLGSCYPAKDENSSTLYAEIETIQDSLPTAYLFETPPQEVQR